MLKSFISEDFMNMHDNCRLHIRTSKSSFSNTNKTGWERTNQNKSGPTNHTNASSNEYVTTIQKHMQLET